MASAAWKRFETSPGYQRAKTWLRRLVGKELRLKKEIQVDTIEEGGWCFSVDGINQDSIVYITFMFQHSEVKYEVFPAPDPLMISVIGSQYILVNPPFWLVTACNWDWLLAFVPQRPCARL